MSYIDFYHDQDKAILSKIEKQPEFLVGHRAMSDDELKSLSPGEFADPVNRMFPISSRAETWRSIAYFNRQGPELIQKTAALSHKSAQEREQTRNLLAKAAQLWGLEDDEVEALSGFVTLGVLKKAEAEPGPGVTYGGTFVPVTPDTANTVACDFLRHAASMDRDIAKNTAGMLLKAAASASAELPADTSHKLQVQAGLGTCTAREAANAIFKVVPHIPHRAAITKVLSETRRALDKLPEGKLLLASQVSSLSAILSKAGTQYNIPHIAETLSSMRTVTPAVIEAGLNVRLDRVKLPGGVRASKAAIARNAEWLGTWLSNTHQAEAYTPDEIIDTLKKLTPVEILPLRARIGA